MNRVFANQVLNPNPISNHLFVNQGFQITPSSSHLYRSQNPLHIYLKMTPILSLKSRLLGFFIPLASLLSASCSIVLFLSMYLVALK
ncbi:hypothetical protein GQ457_11G021420 [Hibiscus cannabinus]